MKKAKNGPTIQIAKRKPLPLWKSWGIRILSVVFALIVCALMIYAIVKMNPLKVYVSMFNGAFGTSKRLWVTIRDTMTLLCIGLGLGLAFRMRFWNIGAEGQVLVGGIAAAACMIYIGSSMSTWLLLAVMFVASAVAGGIWGLIPSIFKARWGTNETLFTLMMNYIAIQLTSYCVALWENPYGSNSVGIINQISKAGWFPAIFGQTYTLNVILVLTLTALVYIYMRYSKHGFEIAVVGESENTARYTAINVKKVLIRTMALSGAICGIAGNIAVAGAGHTISTSTAGGRGFTAIIVAWLAKFNPFVMVLISALLVFLEKGAIEIASIYNLSDFVSDMITGIILFFILGSEFFIRFHVRIHKAGHKEEAAK